jgi:molecular chaperone DnaK
MGHVIGIDLGTTNSCVSVVIDGHYEVIPNKGGYKTTPSIVAVSESGRRLVGQMAKRQAITNAEHTVYAWKRLIGRKWDSPQVVRSVETSPFEIAQGPHDDVRVRLRDKLYSIPEIAGMILQEMKLVAEEYLGSEVTEAVITVPAYFNDAQRQATKDAGRIAGLEVLRIINEPTAAALAYGYGKSLEQTIAVYDLGGGTFDISVLSIQDGVFDVIATAGDSFLGGEDLDVRLIEHLAFEFAAEHQFDLRKDTMALQRLKDAAEKAKCDLSELDQVDVNLPFIHTTDGNEALHLQTTVRREQLEEMTMDLIDRTFKICAQALEDAGLKRGDIDEVVLVGGQTRMPLVQRSAARFFGREPSKGVHPDEVVAVGAAIQASALAGAISDILLLDVTPHSLGVMVFGGGFEVIIERNSTVPTEESHIFTTVKDNQTSVKILVLQGESERAEANDLLGEFVLQGLRPAPAGEVEIEIKFSISADGIVSVSARDLETGLAQSITVTASSGLTEEEIHRMIEENRDYALEIKQSEEDDAQRQEVRKLIRQVEAMMPSVRKSLKGSPVGESTFAKAQDVVDRARNRIDSKSLNDLVRDQEAVQRTLTVFRGIVDRVPSGR